MPLAIGSLAANMYMEPADLVNAKLVLERQLQETRSSLSECETTLASCQGDLVSVESSLVSMLAEGAIKAATASATKEALTAQLEAEKSACMNHGDQLKEAWVLVTQFQQAAEEHAAVECASPM
jgi:hypothetical protein